MVAEDTGSGTADGATRSRLDLVEEHVAAENRHDLDGIMATFGEAPQYEDSPWGDHHHGTNRVRGYYDDLLRALPDLRIDVHRRHVTDEHVILEVVVSGTHEGRWRGLPATGRRVEFPLCAVYTFDDDDRLAGERIYYDRATLLGQLGLFHEPLEGPGRVLSALSHPVTVARAVARRIRHR